jgi:dihydrofolate reductase
MRIVVVNHVSLDGVMQGPGRAEEDTRGGFGHGGWAASRTDESLLRAWGQRLSAGGGFLFGRRTYEDLLGYWNTQDSPFREALNHARKYVVSQTLTEALRWPNSVVLRGEVGAAVSESKKAPGNDLHIIGSGALIHTLGSAGLIDEYVLSIHPLVLGGRPQLFADGFASISLQLIDVQPTSTGVVVATYRPACRRGSPTSTPAGGGARQGVDS